MGKAVSIMTKQKRLAALLVAAAVLFIMLFSALYIAAEVHHDCTGEDCRVCTLICLCQNALKNLSLAICAAAFSAVLVSAFRKILSCSRFFTWKSSPVTLKVKLSD